ncbi:MAG: ATP-binding cassette domain-containing protein [Bacteroidales bacterium]
MNDTSKKDTSQDITSNEILRFEQADIRNGGNLILSNINFTINQGEFCYLIGKVGSGKTSVIRTIIGEEPLKRGHGYVCNYKLHKLKKKHIPYLRRKIGVVFQDLQLLMDRPIYDNLKFVLRATGWKDSKLIRDKVIEVLTDVGMQDEAHKMPHQLSGGEQQRIAIARSLLNDPELILADEPTGNLDNDTTREIMELLTKINKEKNPAVIIITHDKNIVSDFPGRIILCENKSIQELSQREEVAIDFSEFL